METSAVSGLKPVEPLSVQPVAAPVAVPTVVVAPPPQPHAPAMNPTTMNVIVQPQSSGPGFLVRAVWFLLIGWWLSAVATVLAYLLCITIIGLPFGFALFNRLPAVLTLRPRSETYVTEVRNGVTFMRGGTVPQLDIGPRVVWFILVGWWLGAIYVTVAWFLCVIIITLPIGLYLYNRIGAVMTLLRY
jgi:uncharacterized membrane protein YccF (DUF307 family)